MSLGHTRQLPTEDRYLMTRAQFKDMLATLLGGQTAEELTFNEITTGAQNDIEQATKLARAMVTTFGMSEKLGPRTFGHREEMVFLGREISEQRDYSDKIAEQIDDEVFRIIDEAHQVARQVLTENKEKLVLMAKTLITRETLEVKDMDDIFGDKPPRPARKKKLATTTPAPIEPAAETEKEVKPGKTTAVPRLVPKQTPAD
jgi:cell division protease FtsH